MKVSGGGCGGKPLSSREAGVDDGLAGGEAVGVVDLGAWGSGDVAVEKRVVGVLHPAVEAGAEVGEGVGIGGVGGEVVGLVGVEDQVVELLGRDGARAPSVIEPEGLRDAVVAVGQDGWRRARRSGGCS